MRGARARTRRYWNDAAIVRRKKGQALRARLALSTEPGAPNQPAGGGGGGSFITSGVIRQDVALITGEPISTVLTSSAYDSGSGLITRPQYFPRIRLFDVDRSYFAHPGSDILLTAR